ncbi:phytoene desaturase family protein [Fodinicola feengrottensis]|uniref:Phytoene desaturase family protein n=1 Tax=Fodinicola feengrottensis TaxID=435914 RepID=A0ABN2HSN6_9ACTN
MTGVVVVGAGVGGLAVAARLAAGGHHVTVCERAAEVGGKLGLIQVSTSDGEYRFDTGPSLLTFPQVLADLFDETGEPVTSALGLRRLDPIADYRFADGTRLAMRADQYARDAAFDDTFGAGSARQWNAFLSRAENIWAASRGPFLESTVDGPLDLLRQTKNIRDVTTIAPWRSLRSLAAHYLDDPRMRMLVDRYATYTGSDPRRAPAALAAIPYMETTYGGWYVEGGLRKIADALVDRCTALGVEIRTQADVQKITVTPDGVTGVRLTDGEVISARTVVANTDAEVLYRDLLPLPRELRKLRRASRSLSGFVLLLGLSGRTLGLGHHTVLFPENYDAEFDAVFGPAARPVPDPTLYISNPADDTVRPPGQEAWFVLVNAPRQGQVNWREPGLADRYAERLLAKLADRGLDVRDRLRFAKTITPADLQDRTGAVGGAIYGTSSNGARAAFLRPANKSVVPGLFLVGGSSHPGGGLPLVLLSAQLTAGLVGSEKHR